MFRGVDATTQLKPAALDPEPDNPDNIMNILENRNSVFPDDPRKVAQYQVIVEFPGGMQHVSVPILQEDGEFKRMRPGHVLTLRTADARALPLPHPLLLQLHAVCSRMVIMRAAAGHPVLSDDALQVTEEDTDEQEKEHYGQFGGKDETRDPAIVILEHDQRKHEQQQLLQKIYGGR
ncbi:hypothetical protein Q9L58_010383 [Maublancomyces gigas]|uniref:Uncharacterized protein n=1 Tax=Discina gigas TaxID=1032678 RepID=A0ABR3G4H2_9PEZI